MRRTQTSQDAKRIDRAQRSSNRRNAPQILPAGAWMRAGSQLSRRRSVASITDNSSANLRRMLTLLNLNAKIPR